MKSVAHVLTHCNNEDVNSPVSPRDDRCPLHVASSLGNLAIVQLLIWVRLLSNLGLSRTIVVDFAFSVTVKCQREDHGSRRSDLRFLCQVLKWDRRKLGLDRPFAEQRMSGRPPHRRNAAKTEKLLDRTGKSGGGDGKSHFFCSVIHLSRTSYQTLLIPRCTVLSDLCYCAPSPFSLCPEIFFLHLSVFRGDYF